MNGHRAASSRGGLGLQRRGMEAVADADDDTETKPRGVLDELARFGPAHEHFERLAWVRAGRWPRAASDTARLEVDGRMSVCCRMRRQGC